MSLPAQSQPELWVIESVSGRLLNLPVADDFEALLRSPRSIVQIVGPGGCGKTTLAKHIGGLALAGGQPGAFKSCRLPIWIDEDFTDLFAVVKRKVNAWFASGGIMEDEFIRVLLENGLLMVIVDRISERSIATREYLSRVHGDVRCNAILMTTRQPLPIEIPNQRFVYPRALDSSTLLNFMTEIIRYCFRDRGDTGTQPFSKIQSQLELGERLAALVAVRIDRERRINEVPVLPLPVVLFVSEAVALVKNGRDLDELPGFLPDVYAGYLRSINPKVRGIENGMDDETMLRAAKALAKLSLGSDFVPKEFARDQASQVLKNEIADLSPLIDPLQRLAANGVLLVKTRGARTFLRFTFDPIAEFLAAEGHFDDCAGNKRDLEKLLSESERAHGFRDALLQTIQCRSDGLGER